MDKLTVSAQPPFGDIIPFAFPGVAHVHCAFTTSRAGNMALGIDPANEVDAALNRSRVFDALGFAQWAELKQVHGDAMLADPAPTAPESASSLMGDGLATRQKGLALAIKSADCQPLLLADKRARAVAALHVGWRGNTINFPTSGVIRFCVIYNLDPSDVVAVIGPSLGPQASEFVNFEQEWPARFSPWFDESSKTVDLWDLTQFQLIEAGMLPENIYSLDMCTHSNADLFFSHRRGHTGRQLSLIWITEG